MEVEAKFLIENPSDFENYLNQYESPKNLEILDIYFDDEKFNLLKTYDCAFRIRKENERYFMTIKQKLEDKNDLFRRFEFEREISLDLFNKLKNSSFYFCFDNIKLKIFARIEILSKRKLYEINNLKISLDKVIFNDDLIMNFLEIEGNDDLILDFIKELRKHFHLNEWKVSKLETALLYQFSNHF